MTIWHNRSARRMLQTLVSVALLGLSACQAPAGQRDGTTPPASTVDDLANLDPTLAFLKLRDLGQAQAPPASATRQDDTSSRAEVQIDKARQLLGAQRYTEAQQRLSRALRYSPNSYAAHMLMAEVSLQAGNSARAVEHLEHARSIQPAEAELYYLLGKAYTQQQRWDDAITALRTLERCPGADGRPDVARIARYYLALALENRGYLTAATECYETFLASSAADAAGPRAGEAQDVLLAVHVRLAEVYARLGKPRQAADSLAAAVKLAPAQAAYLPRVAEWYRQAGQNDQAVQAARDYFETTGEGLDLLAAIHLEAGQHSRLLQDLQQLAASFPERYDIIRLLVDLYVEDGDLNAGAAMLEAFIEANPGHAQAQVALAEIRVLQRRWVESAMLLDAAILHAPDPQALLEPWLQRLHDSGAAGDALAALQNALQQDRLHCGAAFAVARLAAAQGQRDVAERYLEQCAREAPKFLPALIELGHLQLQAYRWNEALDTATRVIDAGPDDHNGYRLKGRALLGLDRLDEAAEALGSALRHDRGDVASMEALVEVYSLSNKPLKAANQYRMILDAEPDHAEALEALYLNAVNQRDEHLAEEYLQRLSRLKDRGPFRRAQALQLVRQSQDWQAYEQTLREIVLDEPDSIDTRLQLAQQLARDERYDEALLQVHQALETEPDNTSALLLEAVLAIQEFDYEQGIRALQRLLEIHPNRSSWQLTLIQALMSDQRFDEASAALSGFLAADDVDQRVRSRLRRDVLLCLAIDDRVEEALSHVRAWLESEPEDLEYRLMLLSISHLAGRTAEVVPQMENWFNGVLEANDPAEVEHGRIVLLETYLTASRFDDAATLTLAWLIENPDDPDATRRLLRVLQRAEQFDAALEIVDATLQVERNPQAREFFEGVRVGLYTASGRHAEAARLIRERLAALDAGDWSLRRQLAWVLIQDGRPEEALRELRLWDQMVPRGRGGELPRTREDLAALEDIHSLMSLCYQMSGQTSLALQSQERRWQLNPESPGNNNDLGYQFAAEGLHLDRAESMVRRAVRANPREAAYLDSMAWVLYKKGRLDEAWNWLERAARAPMGNWDEWMESQDHHRGADDPVIQDHMGDTAWRLRRPDAAVEHWRRATRLAEDEQGYRSPEVSHILETVPAKIESATSGVEPRCADIAGEGPQ